MPKHYSPAPISLILIAATVVFVGSVARFYELDRMVVRHDEVYSLLRTFGFDETKVRKEVFSDSRLKPMDLLAFQRPSPELGFADTLASLETHPEHSPLFYLAARAATSASASPVVGMRGTSALFSLLLIPAVFWMARELFEGSATAWVAAALVASSPMHLLYAQEARQYALWTVFAAASSAALLRSLREGGSRNWILYGVLVALGLYTHLLFVLVQVAHAIYVAISLPASPSAAMARLRGWGTAEAVAVLVFSPWLAVLVSGFDVFQGRTAWMEQLVSLERLLETWGKNLVRVFADFPGDSLALLLGLIPLAWILWRFCSRAPRSSRSFVCVLFLTFAAAVLVPDLILGGKRSLQARYSLPGFLAVELAAAYVLAAGWYAPSTLEKVGSRIALILVLGLGVWSSWSILQAHTWWIKSFSGGNRKVAALINRAEHPLLIITDSTVALGEAISLAYDLDDKVVIQGVRRGGTDLSTAEFSDVFLLTPSEELKGALGAHYDLVPLVDDWQWYRAAPKSKGPGT
jgi:uncharacterized membrane protein